MQRVSALISVIPAALMLFGCSGGTSDPAGLMITENWRELGFEVDARTQEWAFLSAEGMKARNHQAFMVRWGGKPERVDPYHRLFSMHHSSNAGEGGYNIAGYLNLGEVSDITLLNPLVTKSGHDIYDPLVRLDENGRPVNWPASNIEYLDERTVAVELRDDFAFHDGEPLTVEGVLKNDNLPPVGSGPFIFDYWRPNEEFALKANRDYVRPPFDDVHIHRALTSAIPRDLIVNAVLDGGGGHTFSLVPENNGFRHNEEGRIHYPEDYEPTPYL